MHFFLLFLDEELEIPQSQTAIQSVVVRAAPDGHKNDKHKPARVPSNSSTSSSDSSSDDSDDSETSSDDSSSSSDDSSNSSENDSDHAGKSQKPVAKNNARGERSAKKCAIPTTTKKSETYSKPPKLASPVPEGPEMPPPVINIPEGPELPPNAAATAELEWKEHHTATVSSSSGPSSGDSSSDDSASDSSSSSKEKGKSKIHGEGVRGEKMTKGLYESDPRRSPSEQSGDGSRHRRSYPSAKEKKRIDDGELASNNRNNHDEHRSSHPRKV